MLVLANGGARLLVLVLLQSLVTFSTRGGSVWFSSGVGEYC